MSRISITTHESEHFSTDGSSSDPSSIHSATTGAGNSSLDPSSVHSTPTGNEQGPYLPTAEQIIHEIISRLRHSSDLSEILQLTLERMVNSLHADRGLIWQVSGDRMVVSNEYAVNVPECFAGSKLTPQESAALTLEFLSCFPEAEDTGVLGINDISVDKRLSKVSTTLSALMELGSAKARLIAQLRCRGLLSGFVELQQCNGPRLWSQDDISIMQSVSEILSVVVRQSFDQKRIEDDARKMKLINEISNLFRESGGTRTRDTLGVSIAMAAERMGFCESQIYLCRPETRELVPQLSNRKDSVITLEEKDNPFVQSYVSGKDMVINAEYTTKVNVHFGHETAIIVPLNCENQQIGVLGLWKLAADHAGIRPQDRDLALTVATQLANVIHAENVIAQLRADQSREALINKVSNEIKQSFKDVDQICKTLVSTLSDYLHLSFCSVSLWDSVSRTYRAPQVAYNCPVMMQATIYVLAERLLEHTRGALQDGRVVFLTYKELLTITPSHVLEEHVPGKSTTLIPVINDGQLRAALVMVSEQEEHLPEKDLQMVQNLSDQIAVVLAHAELFAQVEQQALTDPMTGLYNRRYFSEHLSKEIDRNQRFGHSFSCVLCDLDHLKHINDTFGHQYGDAAIKHVAKTLRSCARDVDIVARYGGEEFLILLPETSKPAARIAAERFCKAIRESPVEGIGQITASIGVASFPGDATEKEQLLTAADRALYSAKRQGRNQVQSYSGTEPYNNL